MNHRYLYKLIISKIYWQSNNIINLKNYDRTYYYFISTKFSHIYSLLTKLKFSSIFSVVFFFSKKKKKNR